MTPPTLLPAALAPNTVESLYAEHGPGRPWAYWLILLGAVTVRAPGLVRPATERAEMKTPVGGRIAQLLARDNDHVVAGQPFLDFPTANLDERQHRTRAFQRGKARVLHDLFKRLRNAALLLFGLCAVVGAAESANMEAESRSSQATPAAHKAPTLDGAAILGEAQAKERSLPTYRTVVKRTVSGGRTMTITKLVANEVEGDRITVTERRVEAGGRVLHESRILTDARGDWRLLEDVVIKIPRSFDKVMQQTAELYADIVNGATLPAGKSTIETVTWRDRPHYYVTQTEDQGVLNTRMQMTERLLQQNGGAAAGLKSESLVEARRELWIDAASLFVVRTRILAVASNVLKDEALGEIDLNPTVAADAFRLPPGVPLLFPNDDGEYKRMIAEHSPSSLGKRKTTNKENKK